MRREISFLKENSYSTSFRSIRGHDDEIVLDAEGLKDISCSSGVYIIVSNDKTSYNYPLGKSSVIYVGKADNLHRRLQEHLNHLNDLIENDESYMHQRIWFNSRYQYMKYHGAKVYTFHCLGNQIAKELEAYILWRFYERYRALPVGNGARSFSK